MIKPAMGILFVVLLAGRAEARPRDEAMARAFRCAGQPATRVWLDCFYGAAQPVRDALGMSPAPAAQVHLSEVPPMPGQPADVPLRDAAMAEAARCADRPEDRLWLDCFYAASNPVRAALALQPLAGPTVAARNAPQPAPAPAPAPRRTGGFLAAILGPTVVEARAHMASYSFDARKNFTVTLDNGQVWRQLDGDTGVAQWRKSAGSYLVTITSGALGSHNLTVQGVTGMFKVRRVS